MANLKDIRDGLETRLATIAGLRAHDTIPDQINVPCAIVGAPETIQYDHTMGRGTDRYTIPVRVYAGRASERAGQDKIDGYLAGSGANSIKAAIEADRTLGGVAHSTRVTEARGYGTYPIAGVEYLGVEFVVDIIA